MLTQETVAVAKEAIESFSDLEKMVFEQIILGGMKYKEVVRNNNLKDIKMVDNAAVRVRRKLAKAMAEKGLTPDLE